MAVSVGAGCIKCWDSLSSGVLNNLVPLIIAPESAADNIILKMGELLKKNEFVVRSGSVFTGYHELVNLLYKSGPTNKAKRIEKLSKTFASYSQFEQSSLAILLMEDISREEKSSLMRINELKGTSINPQPGTLRGISNLTRHMYSYVHVPDEDIKDIIIKWAFPSIKILRPADIENQQLIWKMIQNIMTFQYNTKIEGYITNNIVNHILQIILLANITHVMPSSKEDIHFMNHGLIQSDFCKPRIENIIKRLKMTIPHNSYTERMLHVLLNFAEIIIEDKHKNIINAVKLDEIINYCGIMLPPTKLQLLLTEFIL